MLRRNEELCCLVAHKRVSDVEDRNYYHGEAGRASNLI